MAGGAGDNAAAAVGTGVVEEGKAFTTIGTSGVIFAHSNQVTIDPVSYTHLQEVQHKFRVLRSCFHESLK